MGVERPARNSGNEQPAKLKVALYYSLLPYLFALIYGLAHAWSTSPLDDFCSAIWYDLWMDVIWQLRYGGVFTALLLCCVAYQMWYGVRSLRLHGKKKTLFVLLAVSVGCWVLFLFLVAFAYFKGFPLSLLGGERIYGLKAVVNALAWYVFIFSFLPLLPLTFLYIVFYFFPGPYSRKAPRN